jgi:hypothetical protein
MKSPGIQISFGRAELAERLAGVLHSSRAIRSEVALAVCESSEARIAARQLRLESLRTARQIAASRQSVEAHNGQRRRLIAYGVAQVLSSRGYNVFLAAQPRHIAVIQ